MACATDHRCVPAWQIYELRIASSFAKFRPVYKRSKRFVPAKRQRTVAHGPRSSSRALIRLDTEKLRKKALAALKKAEQGFQEADRSRKNFEAIELRAFERWKHLTLGPAFAELHRLMEELQEVEYHLAMAEEEHWRTGQPLWKCFERWKAAEAERRLHPEQPPPVFGPEIDDDDDEDDIFGIFDFDEDDDDFADEEMRGPRGGDRPPALHRTDGPPGKTQAKGDLRSHYRQLCRLLHPDAAGELTAEKCALWHQVQDAYAERDEVRLGNLLARVQQMIGLDVLPRTLAELKSAADHYRRARERLRSALRDATHHPAWMFSLRNETDRNRMANALRYDIGEQSRLLQQRLQYIRQLLTPRPQSAAGNRAKPGGRGRARRSNDPGLDFLF